MLDTGLGTTLVEFYTPDCVPCQSMEPILERLMDAGVKVLRVNAEENVDLATEYSVMGVPTFVLMKDSQPVDSVTGLRPYGFLKKFVER